MKCPVRRCRRRSTLSLAAFAFGLTASAFAQVVTEFAVPTDSSSPGGIALGLDGNVWFTERTANRIGLITPDGVIEEFPIPTPNSSPWRIAAGPDGSLWFTEYAGNQIGRVTTLGTITEFPIPTSNSGPEGITSGPDGSLWFTEILASQIGRITTSGVVTEYPAGGGWPENIVSGPDGNLWFTDHHLNKVRRITTTGDLTEFPGSTTSTSFGLALGPDGYLWFTEDYGSELGLCDAGGYILGEIPTPTDASFPKGITAGPDGNLWFTENIGQIGRATTAGTIVEFPVPTANGGPEDIAVGADENLWFTESTGNNIGRITTGPTTPQPMAVDTHSASGTSSNGNGVLESGETVLISPSWKNTLADPQSFTGSASNLTGPPGPTYTIDDALADYGTVSGGATADCDSATADCYLMTISGTRPAAHWDATFTESLSSNSTTRLRTLHVGESFPDVPTSHQFYRFIENLFHNGITGGCAGGNYCPDNSVTRAQMAVFLMKSKLGASEVPPSATGAVFGDVPSSNPFASWIEQLAGFLITGGCGGGNYCPASPVTRAQMAVFLLKAEHGSSYVPPSCAGAFGDVTCPSLFADWIERLAAEGITGGCGGGNYCPSNAVTRGQMAVFLVKTFGLTLYRPSNHGEYLAATVASRS